MAPRFTVLLPTHNRADVVGYAIQSVLAQSETSFELLVVGDGCTDNTAQVVNAFDDPRVRWFDFPKGPYSGYNNRNRALAEARGEMIAYAAHDDLLFPDHLVLLGKAFAVNEAVESVYSRPLWVAPDGLILPLSGNLMNGDELDVFLTQANFIPSPCVAHRRSCLQRYGFWPEDTPRISDWLFWRTIIEEGARANLAYCSVPTTLHFKAVWRESLEHGIPSVGTILREAKRAAWWPEALRFRVDPGEPEQAVLSRQLCGSTWIASVRRAVPVVVERLAWNTTANLQELEERQAQLSECDLEVSRLRSVAVETETQLNDLESEIMELRQMLLQEHRNAAALQQDLRNITSSRSWRLTSPLRKLRKLATHLGVQ